MSSDEPVIRVENLTKRYGGHVAVDDVSFDVRRGEIFGVLGPNGAGKTTTVESAMGLRTPDRGTIRVLGLDPARRSNDLRQRIGTQLQEAALPERMTVREACRLYARLYARSVPWEPLVERWGIAGKRDAKFGDLSGGQKQRLFIALALINDPEVVFLDELTTGLDPQARRNSWALVEEIRASGKTVVLVTHFMEEAERLCDRIAVIDRGRIVALDTPDGLRAGLGRERRVRFTPPAGFDPAALGRLPGVTALTREGDEVVVAGEGYLMAEVAVALREAGLAPADLRTEQVSLEDAFLTLTGGEMRDV